MVAEPGRLDVGRCEELAARASGGDPDAARLLVEHLWPAWVRMVRGSRSMGPLARSEDDVHNVVGRLVEKIGRPDGRGLRLYPPWKQTHPGKTFEDWIRIVTANAIRDYVRGRLGPVRERAGGAEPSVKRLLNEFASSAALESQAVRPPFTLAETARELLAFATARLPAGQMVALRSWLEGATFEEMAATLKSTPDDAQRLLRAGIAVLRRQFGTAPGDLEPSD